jgi:2-polyprenyl-3-methyl-5-hydroxy-6-metoxy-1,4-benzoquinol methylase
MVNSEYKKSYSAVFKAALRESPNGYYDESALPSYTHNNKLMSWLFWKRINTVFAMADDIKGKSVLDFGCGGGITFKYLNECNCKITGCDTNSYELALKICNRFGVKADLYRNIFDLKSRRFDYILALDVLEHIDNVDTFIDKFMELSHDKTKIIISGPTENTLYKLGRVLAGFSGHYHVRNIYDIEREFKKKQLKNNITRNLFFPFTLFRISSWSK